MQLLLIESCVCLHLRARWPWPWLWSQPLILFLTLTYVNTLSHCLYACWFTSDTTPDHLKLSLSHKVCSSSCFMHHTRFPTHPPITLPLSLSLMQLQNMFGQWAKQYNRTYTQEDFQNRFGIFKENVNFIREHNQNTNNTYNVSLNQFGDLRENEYLQKYGGFLDNPQAGSPENDAQLAKLVNITAADSVDWREKNAVTPVMNQGQCGSCWTYSVAGALEGHWALQYGQLEPLANQQLLDCAGSYGNQGCRGGFMDWTWKYVRSAGGVCKYSDYPYVGKVTRCQKSCKPVARIDTHVTTKARDEDQLMKAANLGPVAVAVTAAAKGFQFYHSGIISSGCGTNLDHAVVLTGYGKDKLDYWTIKSMYPPLCT